MSHVLARVGPLFAAVAVILAAAVALSLHAAALLALCFGFGFAFGGATTFALAAPGTARQRAGQRVALIGAVLMLLALALILAA